MKSPFNSHATIIWFPIVKIVMIVVLWKFAMIIVLWPQVTVKWSHCHKRAPLLLYSWVSKCRCSESNSCDFIAMLFGDSSQCNAFDYYKIEPPNGDHKRITKGLYCNLTWWLVTNQQSQSDLSGVTKSRSLERNNNMNKRYDILVNHSDCDTCDHLYL